MIEKILNTLKKREEDLVEEFTGKCTTDDLVCVSKIREVEHCQKIVQEVAKEYGKDTNVRSKEYEKGYEDGYEEGAEAVRALAPYEDGWIPTAEMLFPRYGQKVLASVRTDIATHEVIITKYEREEYWHNGIITAWMELPAPYQKGE